MRELSQIEQERIEALTQNSIELAFIAPMESEFEKSRIEIPAAFIEYLKKNDLQDVFNPESTFNNVAFIKGYSTVSSSCSLTRSQDSTGNDWIWFEDLHQYARPNDVLGVVVVHGKIYLLNITQVNVEAFVRDAFKNPINEIIRAIQSGSNGVAEELLTKLKQLTGPIVADLEADTAVGRMLEKLLGLKINSSKKPDYKGIEIKAFRQNRENRHTLFAQVPNWEHCKLKSSAEILATFGYKRGENNKLYCTLSTKGRNSQGLKLRVDKDTNRLIENSKDPKFGDFGVWELSSLHKNLKDKHFETFWVGFKSQKISGKEHFILSKITHTKNPIPSQFDELIQQGIITVDHLIKRQPNGKVVEKGPLFKIERSSLQLLFSQSKAYL